jgi:hypothetical protein
MKLHVVNSSYNTAHEIFKSQQERVLLLHFRFRLHIRGGVVIVEKSIHFGLLKCSERILELLLFAAPGRAAVHHCDCKEQTKGTTIAISQAREAIPPRMDASNIDDRCLLKKKQAIAGAAA